VAHQIEELRDTTQTDDVCLTPIPTASHNHTDVENLFVENLLSAPDGPLPKYTETCLNRVYATPLAAGCQGNYDPSATEKYRVVTKDTLFQRLLA
jgi:hypothetical protein